MYNKKHMNYRMIMKEYSRVLLKNYIVAVALLMIIVLELVGATLGLGHKELFVPRLITLSSFAASIFLLPHLKDGVLKNTTTLSIPLFALAIVTLTVINTPLADKLAAEDSVIEWLSALMLFAASVAMASLAVMLFVNKSHVIAVIIALACSLVFFIIGMEEISWMQRVFEVETPAYLIEANKQKELNFHNLATGFFEQAYYLGGFILLTVLPYIHNYVKLILGQFSYTRQLVIFLPPPWFVIPFSIISFFVISPIHMSSFMNPVYIAIYTFTFFILLATAHAKALMNNSISVVAITIVLITAVISIVALPYIDYGHSRFWLIFEYREFFIALGIALYAICIVDAFTKSKDTVDTHERPGRM